MKNKKIIIGVFILIFVCQGISAVVVFPVVMPVDNSPASAQGNCIPPIDFAKEYGCTLDFYTKTSVNTYRCGNYVIEADCKGGIYSKKELSFSEKYQDEMMFGTMFMVAIAFLFMILRILNGISKPFGQM